MSYRRSQKRPAVEKLEDRCLLHHCVISFSSATYSVGESGGTASITLLRDVAAGDVTVDFNASAGTAGANDFTPIASQTINWLGTDSNQKTVQVSITPDSDPESNETVLLTLDNFVFTFPGNITSATLTINDDDAAGSAPVIGNFGGSITYVENAAAKIISSTGTITDADSANFAGGKLTVGYASGGSASDRLAIHNTASLTTNASKQIFFNGNQIGTFNGGTGTTALVINMNNRVTPAIATTLLRNVEYSNVSDNPTAQRVVSVTISDGDGFTSLAIAKTINVTPKNDAPVLNASLSPTLPTIPEDAANPNGTLVSSLIAGAVTDADGAAALKGIAVIGVPPNGGTWEYSTNGGTNWLGLGGASATTARLLASNASTKVRFHGATNFSGQSQITFRAWDQTQGAAGNTFNIANVGGTTAFSAVSDTAAITVSPVNDTPTLGGINGSVGYTADAAAIVLAAAATVADVDSPDFDTGELRVRITGTDNGTNRLEIGGGFTVDGSNNVFLGANQIGTRSGSGVGTNDLVVSFNANATKAVVQQLVRAITFRTVGGSSGARSVIFSVSDGDGATSLERTRTVNVS